MVYSIVLTLTILIGKIGISKGESLKFTLKRRVCFG